jgi:hypothetical protein
MTLSSPIETIGWLAFGLGLLAACGNDVVVQSGSGGSGASTATPTGTTPTTSTLTTYTDTTSVTTWTTSTTTGAGGAGPGIAGLCAELCELIASCEGEPGCADECVNSYTPGCASVYAAFLNCVVGAFDVATCELPAQCQAVMNQWASCEGEPPPPCGPQACSQGSDGSCNCQMECTDVLYESACTPAGYGSSDCRCSLDGESVGECTGSGPMPCDIQSGCCAAYFFWDEY